jgi:hypothetical protein
VTLQDNDSWLNMQASVPSRIICVISDLKNTSNLSANIAKYLLNACSYCFMHHGWTTLLNLRHTARFRKENHAPWNARQAQIDSLRMNPSQEPQPRKRVQTGAREDILRIRSSRAGGKTKTRTLISRREAGDPSELRRRREGVTYDRPGAIYTGQGLAKP